MAAESALLVGRADDTYLVRVLGRGTLQESLAFSKFTAECLRDASPLIVVDLSQCDYLDSTFMGCLMGVHKACEGGPARLRIVASPATRLQLFSTTLLDRVFEFDAACPPFKGELLALAATCDSERELGQHVMRCHRRLAEAGGQDADAFRSVADRLAEELGE